MKIFFLMALMMLLGSSISAAPEITNVKVEPYSPWGKVMLEYTLSEDVLSKDVVEDEYALVVTASNRNTQVVYETYSLKGDVSYKKGTHRIWWDMAAENVFLSDAQVDFQIALIHEAIQLWENGPLWATKNIGASKPEESGYFFWWGDTVGYKRTGSGYDAVDGSKTGFTFASGDCPTYNKSDAELKSSGYITDAGVLADKYDAARKHWGRDWRMPTSEELDELVSNTTTEWIVTNGVWGRLVCGKGAFENKSIFLPAVGFSGGATGQGYYWSATSYSDYYYYSSLSCYLFFNSADFGRDKRHRYLGQTIRPIKELSK